MSYHGSMLVRSRITGTRTPGIRSEASHSRAAVPQVTGTAADLQRWSRVAACGPDDLDLFFAPDKEPIWHRQEREVAAKDICASCPIRARCLEFAIVNSESGIWAGTTEEERAAMKRKVTRAAAKAAGS